ncbi:MAG TPA: hypothetical protein VE861_03465 [Gemmatimonadaceae bacterium]|nr:hypothetical protein [Gemmatimonadaceae bacterium]
MAHLRLVGGGTLLVLGLMACQSQAGEKPVDRVVATSPTGDSNVVPASPDSIPEERPDSIPVTPPDSATLVLQLLPAPPGGAVAGDVQALADRAVFAPRTQRWFMARSIDSAPSVDIGRLDGGIGNTDAARAALARVIATRSPVQPGMQFTMHSRAGSVAATVLDVRLSGRRLVARLDAPALDADAGAAPVEWRGEPPAPLRAGAAARCTPGDTAAIEAAIARVAATRNTPRKDAPPSPVPPKPDSVSVLRGCFGDFRAIVTVRPVEITPESVERATFVRAAGTTRTARLRDLSYPLHELVGVIDIDADGVHEIVVHSFRPAMDTWAALRMTDSVTFTRFASGFTIERR